MADLVEVYRGPDVPQAYLVCNFLQDAGIPAVVEGDALQAALGALPLGWNSQPRVMVHAENAAWARSLLDAVEAAADDEPLPDSITSKLADESSAEDGLCSSSEDS